ncbi:MAG: AtpZ/AtpI family protein [Actinobacteria bacterium]|nr:AtpZ/AtpI family protein [Actinomycetota bacterium]
MDASGDRQSLYNGFGDTMSRAVEFVATPAIFGWLGHLIDGRTGTRPTFTLVLACVAVVGMFLRYWFGYVHAMEAEEAKGPWRKP